MRARQLWIVLLSLGLAACGPPARPVIAEAPPPAPVSISSGCIALCGSGAPDVAPEEPPAKAPAKAKPRPPTGCEVVVGELEPARPPADPPLPPDLAAIVRRIRHDGFQALPAIWGKLGIKETHFRDRGAEPCFEDARSCLEVVSVSPPVGSVRHAILRLTEGFTLDVDDGTRRRRGEHALLLAFAVTATTSRFIGHVSTGENEENWGDLPRARVVGAGDRAFLAVKTAPHCGTGCLFLPERWFDLAEAVPGPLRPVLTFDYGGHSVPIVPYYDREFKGEIEAVGARGGIPYVEVAFTACHFGPTGAEMGDYFSEGDPPVAFTRRGKARFGWSAKARRFVLQPGPGKLDEGGIESFTGGGYRNLVEHAFPDLRAIAVSTSPTRRVLRDFLERYCFAATDDARETCRASPRAAELRRLLQP